MSIIRRRLPLGRRPRSVRHEQIYNTDRGVIFVPTEGGKVYKGWTPVGGETMLEGVKGRFYEISDPAEGFVSRSKEKYE